MRVMSEETKGVLDRASAKLAKIYKRNRPVGHHGISPALRRLSDRTWVMRELYSFYYKDEFEHIVAAIKPYLEGDALANFEERVAALAPRTDTTFKEYLEKYRPDGYTPV